MPPDELPEEGGGENCPNCRTRQECTPAHGRRYVGAPGFGFRTNRCLADWAASPFVHQTEQAYGWSQQPGGGFAQFVGADPPALLLDAVAFYATETAVRHAREIERARGDKGAAGA